MPLPSPYLSIEEKQMRSARVGSQQWEFERIFRVITREDQPPLGPIAAIQCPGIPALGTAYRDFISNEYVPWALLFDYDAQPVNNQYQWDIVCKYSTLERSPRNGGGLQSPPTPGMPNTGGGGSNPDDPTQLLPKVRTGVEVVKVPYVYDPQGKARYKDRNGNTLGGNFNFSRFANTAGDRFAVSATVDIPLRTYQISLYYTDDRDPSTHGMTVNSEAWDGYAARSLLCKFWTTARERFGTSWYWLHNFEFVYDPYFFHTFTILNSGFRELQEARQANLPDTFTRKLIDIQTNGVRTSVEWPLNFSGKKIEDPGFDQSNLIWAEFNKFPSSNFTSLPFTLSEFGL